MPLGGSELSYLEIAVLFTGFVAIACAFGTRVRKVTSELDRLDNESFDYSSGDIGDPQALKVIARNAPSAGECAGGKGDHLSGVPVSRHGDTVLTEIDPKIFGERNSRSGSRP